MAYIEPVWARGQLTFMPDCLDDYVTENSVVRVIDVFVNGLDMAELGFRRAKPAAEGAPGFDPRTLLKIVIYGYMNNIRSSRKLMRECMLNVEVMWLTERLTPDFRVISDFRKDNKEALKNTFKKLVSICHEIGAIKNGELTGIDGSKFHAVNARANCYTKDNLNKKIEETMEKIDKYLKEVEENDAIESIEEIRADRSAELAEKIAKTQEYLDKLKKIKKEMEESGKNQICTTDPESALMDLHGHKFVAHNVQIGVTAESHIVVAVEPVRQGNDLGTIVSTTAAIKENIGVAHVETTEDKGYTKIDDIKESILNGDVCNVIPDKNHKDGYNFELEYVPAEDVETLRTSEKPEDIKACLQAGVLPTILENKGISIELDVEHPQVKFERDIEAKTATCPHGKVMDELTTTSDGSTDYFSDGKGVCKKCTRPFCKIFYDRPSMQGFVPFEAGETVIDFSPHLEPIIKGVKVKFVPDKEKTSKRKCCAEHPFGTIKRARDGSYLLLKGLIGAAAEMSLMFLGYNITRLVNMFGITELTRRMEAIA